MSAPFNSSRRPTWSDRWATSSTCAASGADWSLTPRSNRCGVDWLVRLGAHMGIDVGRARDASEIVVEDVFGDPRGGVQRCVEDVARRRIDQAERQVGFGDLLGDGLAAKMNIASVTRLASVASTAMPIAGKM